MDPILLQKQVRDNAEDLQSCLKDLKNWESEMKRKEDEIGLCPSLGQPANKPSGLPPVRNKVRKTEKNPKHKETVKYNRDDSSSRPRPRIPGFDYSSWDKFDVDKACQQVDDNLEESEEETESEEEDIETEKLHDEAMYEKEKGNQFVKSQKWTNAIECYSRAIECYPYDAIFYANRALCHLKTSNLKAAETDCTSALSLDISYVKAFQRRSAARIGLGLLEEAKSDLQKVIQLEPKNSSAKGELAKIEKKINAKQNEKKDLINEEKKADKVVANLSLRKDKDVNTTSSSAGGGDKASAPLDWRRCLSKQEKKGCEENNVTSLGLEKGKHINSTTSSFGGELEKASAFQDIERSLTGQGKKADKERRVTFLSPEKDGSVASTSTSTESCQLVYPIHKPPHLRSKKPMKNIDIKIMNFGMGKKPQNLTEFITSPKIIEVEETTSKVDIKEKIHGVDSSTGSSTVTGKQKKSPTAVAIKPIEEISDVPPPPKSYIDFYDAWKRVKHSPKMRFLYLKQTPGEQLSKVFQESLESSTFSELIETLETGFLPLKEPMYSYLLGMSKVKRLSALTMFMDNVDRTRMAMLLDTCERVGECSQEEKIMLKKKFEL